MKRRYKVLIALYSTAILANILALLAKPIQAILGVNWCDVYLDKIHPLFVEVFSRITNCIPFSVGEMMLVLLVLYCLVFLLIAITFFITRIKPLKELRFSDYTKKIMQKSTIVTLFLGGIVFWIMSLNCTFFYHATKLDGNASVAERQYTIEELEILRNYIVSECNTRSKEMTRDENGRIVYEGDLQLEAKEALLGISDELPRMKGYYPNVKMIQFSGLMCQSNMAGWYFPFSFEANVNALMYTPKYPGCYCHELSHLHGYIQEDEANFIAFLACINSDDPFFQYCGYLDVLYYVNNTYYRNLNGDDAYYQTQPKYSALVREDKSFLLPEVKERVEANAVLPTQTVNQATQTFVETNLAINGVPDGLAAYERVVDLLLQYYDGILY